MPRASQPAERQAARSSTLRPSMSRGARRCRRARRVDVAELRPLGEVQHQVGAAARPRRRVGVGQRGEPGPRGRHRLRVVDADVRTRRCSWPAIASAGRVAHVVAVGLERRAPDADPGAGHRAADHPGGDLGDPLPLALVDVVDLAQERHRVLDAELAGAVHERADVLGQAAAAEADAGVEELAADARVVADRVGEVDHVRAGGLAHLGHGVDERDLGGQERVGGDLHQLGGRVVGDDDRDAGVGDRRVELAHRLLGPLRRRRRTRSGRAAGCPRPRSPRAGTPGSRPARRPRRRARWRSGARRAGRRCRPGRSTCRRRTTAG